MKCKACKAAENGVCWSHDNYGRSVKPNGAKSMKDQRLEERYVVLKLKQLTGEQSMELMLWLGENELDTVDCVVVEADWPEYTPTVDAIMARTSK